MTTWERLHQQLRVMQAAGRIEQHDTDTFLILFKQVHALERFYLANREDVERRHAQELAHAIDTAPNVTRIPSRAARRIMRGGAA